MPSLLDLNKVFGVVAPSVALSDESLAGCRDLFDYVRRTSPALCQFMGVASSSDISPWFAERDTLGRIFYYAFKLHLHDLTIEVAGSHPVESFDTTITPVQFLNVSVRGARRLLVGLSDEGIEFVATLYRRVDLDKGPQVAQLLRITQGAWQDEPRLGDAAVIELHLGRFVKTGVIPQEIIGTLGNRP